MPLVTSQEFDTTPGRTRLEPARSLTGRNPRCVNNPQLAFGDAERPENAPATCSRLDARLLARRRGGQCKISGTMRASSYIFA